jgi:Ca2+-binding RTX toxin-like protein
LALIVISDNTNIGTGIGVNIGGLNDAFVAGPAVIVSLDSDGLQSSGNDQKVDVQGTVVGFTNAIDLGFQSGHGQTLYIGANAYVANTSAGEAAVLMLGDHDRVTNRGTIHGVSYGLEMRGNGPANFSTIDNFGLIEGGVGIFRNDSFALNDQQIILRNTGEIRGTFNGILGRISYQSGLSSVAVDHIENAGLMSGQVWLGAGDDFYDGTGGRVEGGVFGGVGNDKLTGGDWADFFAGDAGDDELNGAGGDDLLSGAAGFDTVDGGAGNDTLDGGSEADTLFGGDGDDKLDGGTGADTLHGDAGNDVLEGGSESDWLFGGDGDDKLDGGTGADTMIGDAGNDTFTVDNESDRAFDFGGGVDVVLSSVTFNFADPGQAQGALENLVLTGAGDIDGFGNALNNEMIGNDNNNVLKGMGGNDTLRGLAGNDRMDGGVGADTLIGGLGDDRLDGGVGKDIMTGGLGKDQFVFDTKLDAKTNRDVVTDFLHGIDKILLDNAIFKTLGLVPGALKASFFYVGKAAHDANDHIIYNKATGVLSYDVDGVGGRAAVQFATLATHPTINYHDFQVI